MHVITQLEFRVLSALQTFFVGAGWTCLLVVSSTVPACHDGTRGGSGRWPARGLVRPALTQGYTTRSQHRPANLFQNKKGYFPKSPGMVRPELDGLSVPDLHCLSILCYSIFCRMTSRRETTRIHLFGIGSIVLGGVSSSDQFL